MKKTGTLKVLGDIRMPFNQIIVNPNDGYDLDVLAQNLSVRIHAGVSVEAFSSGEGFIMDGSLVQDNTCKLGVVEMNLKTIEQIGKPTEIFIALEGNNILISG